MANETTIAEIPYTRERYGNDRRAINRHSTREYVTSNGGHYLLDRTLDVDPPFFTLYVLPALMPTHYSVPVMPQIVPIDGANYWGDGITWARAETLALATIAKDGSETTP